MKLRFLSLVTPLVLLVSCAGPSAETMNTSEWEGTLDRVARGVVALRVNVPRGFDTEGTGSFLGTGFIVDLERGLILTNRHLVQPGPVVAEAILLNHEEIDLEAVYRDPVHDFGIFRFDPSTVRFMDLAELELAPDAARVGMDIRVVGNDAGEKLSILSGTLARLDRPAPDYGDGFNDFNTFYYQAASDTSGGSSGSPVVALDGRVVALNAGGSWRSASSYYLPLHRVARALDLIRADLPVARGTLTTVFLHKPFDELRRLGLSSETEVLLRQERPDEVGMLVVEQVVPGGPAEGLLETGDILVRVNGELVSRFLPLESALDESVGSTIDLTVERGGEIVDVEITVADLHAVTPAEYVEVGGGVLHTVSLQQARNNHIPPRGVYLAWSGYMWGIGGLFEGALIHSVDGADVDTLDALWTTLSRIPDGERVTVRFSDIMTPLEEHITVVRMDRRWHPMLRCTRDDGTGYWPCESAPTAPVVMKETSASTTFATGGAGPTPTLARSLAMVEFRIPYRVEGVWGASFTGTGLVVDADQGLILVDRDTVPIGLGDVNVTFGGSLRVPAQVVFIHPLHNFAVVRYDPEDIGDTPVEGAVLRQTDLEQGDTVWLVGLDGDYQLVSRQTQVADSAPLRLPLPGGRPQFRDTNIETISVEDSVPTLGGVLADGRGRVLALWASFHVSAIDDLFGMADDGLFEGIPVEILEMVLDPLRRGEEVTVRTLGVELGTMNLADARDLGLSDEWADALEAHNPDRRQALSVSRLFGGSPAADLLQGGDLLIAANGSPVTRFMDIDRVSQRESVELTILRNGEVLTIDVATVSLDGRGIDRVLAWSGLLLHRPHFEVSSQRGIIPNGVYTAWMSYGSPASASDVRPTFRIVAVDGIETPDLDAFLAAVDGRDDRDALRLSVVDLEDRPHTLTLRLDLRYWPTFELRLSEDGWERIER